MKFQILIVPSSEHDANLLSDGAKLQCELNRHIKNESTWDLEWHLYALEMLSDCSCYFASTWWFPYHPQWPSMNRCATRSSHAQPYRGPRKGISSIMRMMRSPTWRIVSKLNVRPFHSVNSPVYAPVIKRRLSGVHLPSKLQSNKKLKSTLTQLMGHFCLLIDEWMNFGFGTDVIGFSW